jgi:hypothetical protein
MKATFFAAVLLGLAAALPARAQSAHDPADRCGQTPALERLAERDPASVAGIEAARRQVLEYAARQALTRDADPDSTIFIPVVVHVVYNTPAQNISAAQVKSQIRILNEDFNRLNLDFASARTDFRAVAGTANIQFCLAETDPTGAPTDGIVRVETDNTSFESGDAPNGWDNVKFELNGGSDGWPRNQYLNIWVCNLAPSAGVLGYAYPPGVSGVLDGVVISYRFFGNEGVVTPPYNLGRTTTHEVGHWLGLQHIWGDGGCGVDDGFDDTPTAGGPNYGCPSATVTTCGTLDMWENYMDYTDDRCMVMFTEQQVAFMRNVLLTSRSPILNSPRCWQNTALDDPGAADEDGIRLWPNPVAAGRPLSLGLPAALDREAILEVFDATGRPVERRAVPAGFQTAAVATAGMAPGLYTLRLSGEGLDRRHRFLVVR